jgi:hypothetical protein
MKSDASDIEKLQRTHSFAVFHVSATRNRENQLQCIMPGCSTVQHAHYSFGGHDRVGRCCRRRANGMNCSEHNHVLLQVAAERFADNTTDNEPVVMTVRTPKPQGVTERVAGWCVWCALCKECWRV